MIFRGVEKSRQIFLSFCHSPRVWQTDGRTDRRTDRILIATPRRHSMQRGENETFIGVWLNGYWPCHCSCAKCPPFAGTHIRRRLHYSSVALTVMIWCMPRKTCSNYLLNVWLKILHHFILNSSLSIPQGIYLENWLIFGWVTAMSSGPLFMGNNCDNNRW